MNKSRCYSDPVVPAEGFILDRVRGMQLLRYLSGGRGARLGGRSRRTQEASCSRIALRRIVTPRTTIGRCPLLQHCGSANHAGRGAAVAQCPATLRHSSHISAISSPRERMRAHLDLVDLGPVLRNDGFRIYCLRRVLLTDESDAAIWCEAKHRKAPR
jgi:hypothetical protein